MSTFTPIDLAQLPTPDVVEPIDYEAILAERKAFAISLWPADKQAEVAATLALESEPLTKLLQENRLPRDPLAAARQRGSPRRHVAVRQARGPGADRCALQRGPSGHHSGQPRAPCRQ